MIFLISCQTAENGDGNALNRDAVQSQEKEVDHSADKVATSEKPLICGADQFEKLSEYIDNRSIAVVANQTSRVGDTHLVDTLVAHGEEIRTVFAPEHGFRGKADAGAHVQSGKDEKTGLPIVSLYGKNKKPDASQLEGIELILFDIQDVGARFYTYISTLHYVMEACAENDIPVIVLDRPNPNGHYVDGPVLNPDFSSFVGMHPIPIVHGMTVGELAKLINGEGWLKNELKCDLRVLKMKGYHHDLAYSLPVAPSPNLRSDVAIQLYPTLCLFEGTVLSVGRGTNRPFEMFGHPALVTNDKYDFTFTPTPGFGAQHPKLNGEKCYGLDLGNSESRMHQINLKWLIDAYKTLQSEQIAMIERENWFDKLAGTDELRQQLRKGVSAEAIRSSWQPALDEFKSLRKRYLLYPEERREMR
ncbi:MAG: exo-beta-N-acetylmuramidase NamZ family protein [Bacteroidota bacterium]